MDPRSKPSADGRSRHPDRTSLSGGAVQGDASVLHEVLEESRTLGFLGPGPLEVHLAHSEAFAALVPSAPTRAIDLGTGGGVPGLILAMRWPATTWLLLDANRRRTDFLVGAVDALGVGDRVVVRCERAEETGRSGVWRGWADLITARGFGPPAVTAECAAPLLVVGGTLVVSEPPGGRPDRWAADPLLQLGLIADGGMTEPVALQRFRQVRACPDRYPRRTGIPAKRPLF